VDSKHSAKDFLAVNPLLLGGLFDVAKSIISKIWPDPQQQAEAQLRLLQLQQTGELAKLASETDLAKLQIQTNIEEAKSGNWFIAGWRPATGWSCAIAFAYSYILFPFLQFLVFAFGNAEMVKQVSLMPRLDLAAMLPVLFGMLGLSHHRTDEKKAGAEGNR